MEDYTNYKYDYEFMAKRKEAMAACTADIMKLLKKQGIQGTLHDYIEMKLKDADRAKHDYLHLQEQLKEREARILKREMAMAQRDDQHAF